MVAQEKLINIGVNIAEGTMVTLGIIGELINKTGGVVTAVVNATVNGKEDVDGVKESLEGVPTDPILPQVNVNINGDEGLLELELGLMGVEGTKTTTVDVNDLATLELNRINAYEFAPKTVSVNFAKGSGFSGLDFEPDGTIKIDPSELGITETKAMGGYTAPVGRQTPAGIVHGGEWVAPAWMVEDSKFSRAIESLEESRRTRGYASGGTVMPQQTKQQTLVFNFNSQLIQDDHESKRKIAEWVHESFKEAGVTA